MGHLVFKMPAFRNKCVQLPLSCHCQQFVYLNMWMRCGFYQGPTVRDSEFCKLLVKCNVYFLVNMIRCMTMCGGQQAIMWWPL
jgi:hypothetical protein